MPRLLHLEEVPTGQVVPATVYPMERVIRFQMGLLQVSVMELHLEPAMAIALTEELTIP